MISKKSGLFRKYKTLKFFFFFTKDIQVSSNFGICLLCGRHINANRGKTGLPNLIFHLTKFHEEWTSAEWLSIKSVAMQQYKNRKKIEKVLKKHYLKPWKDPQSLFCSPKLKKIINKDPLRGDECI